MSLEPLQLAFYKGLSGKFGAIQFSPQMPHWYVKGNNSLKNYDGRYIKDEWLSEHPNLTKKDLTSREGAIFVDISSPKGKNLYDWDNKISMALSIVDLGKILEVLEGRKEGCSLLHDPGANTPAKGKVQKTFKMHSPKGIKEGCFVTVSMVVASSAADKLEHKVPLSGDECLVLAACIRGFLPAALGWL